ncbi:MAG: S8 family serine peptidase [Clostridia bacterium]
MKKFIAVLTAIALMPVSAVFASPQVSEEKVTLIVEVSGDTVLEAKKSADDSARVFAESDEAQKLEKSIKSRQMQVMSEIEKKVDSSAELGFTYSYVFNGFSLEAYESDIEKIKALPNVENVYIAQKHELHESSEEQSGGMYLDFACEMMNTDYLHDSGITGSGTVIAIIDNGFDVEHEIFQGEIKGAKLSKNDIDNIIQNESLSINACGGDATVNRVYRSEKIPYAYNYDYKNGDVFNSENAHGMHVAGIAAGNNGTDPLGGKFTGTAPDAQLLLMAAPNISDEVIIAAIDDAIKLGADVINASFGDYYQEENEPIRIAVINATNAGVIFSSAAGNGYRGYNSNTVMAENIDYGTSGVPDSFSASTSVASANNTNVWLSYYIMTVGSDEIKFSEENQNASFVEAFKDGEYEYVYVGTGLAEEFNGVDAENKIALIERGQGLSFALRIANAKANGAVGAVFINNDEAINIGVNPASLQDIPTAAVFQSDGEKMKAAENKKLKAAEGIQSGINHKSKTEMSDFTSWGVNSTLELKPEITAPGGYVYSSVNDDKYENMSGTSMAAPHMTGAVALLKQYIRSNPEKYGNPCGVQLTVLVENLLMSSADVLMENSESQIPYSPRMQGAGMVNLKKAVNTPVTLIGGIYGDGENVYSKSKISLGEINSSEIEITFKARNLTDTDAVYDNIKMTVITDSADENGFVSTMRKLTFSADLPECVTVPANEETEIKVNVTLDIAELEENMETFTNGFFIDGFVFLGTNDESLPEISIPFMGFYGEWDSVPALDKPVFEEDSVLGLTYMASRSFRETDGSYTDEKSRKMLGANQFISEVDSEYYDYCSEEFVGISPNGDGEFDALVGIVTPLRQLGRTDFYIYDNAGNLIAEEIDISSAAGEYYYARKFDPSYLEFDDKTINSLKDGDYTFKVKSGFLAQKEYSQNESIEMKFYVDRTKPVITKLEIREDGDNAYLDVAATDNRHLMGFVVSGTKNDVPFREVYPIKGTESAEYTFDITGVDLKTLSVEAVDYALNSEVMSAEGLNIYYAGTVGNSFLFQIDNTSGDVICTDVTVALYNNGELVGTDSRNITIQKGKSIESFNIPNAGYDTIKVFIWESLNNIKPLYSVFEF